MKPSLWTALPLVLLALSACQAGGARLSPTPLQPHDTVDTPHNDATSEATASPIPSPTLAPPASFQSDLLRPGIQAVSYIGDACQALADRWDPAGSTPGTVVAPIMFHSILQDDATPADPSAINEVTFNAIMKQVEDLGFQTITSEQLLAFLEDNAKIPPRSVIFILDDRRPGTIEDEFLPLLEKNDWTLTLAWIAQSDTAIRPGRLAGESLWDWIERLNETGRLDVQSHGLNHVYLNDQMSEDAVREEIAGSIPVLKEHFGNTPIVYIWPGGDYTALGVQVARDAGFQLGFTVHSRGPLLFNWIPQGDEEMQIDDPLMLLPRFWSSAAQVNLQQAADIGDAARAFAKENYAAEAAWYQANCSGQLPPVNDVLR